MRVIRSREEGPSEQRGPTFTGTVWTDQVMNGTDGVMITTVVFTPGARTHWHTHAIGQILQVLNGRGYIQVRGGEGTVLTAGDTVWIPAGEDHWHGGLPDTLMTHTAISLGDPDWRDAVSEDDYAAAAAKA